MRKFPWFLAAFLALPAAGWSQPQAQAQPQSTAGDSSATTAAAPAAAPEQDSLAAAARKAREQRKDTPKTAKVFTNDNLPTQGGISTVGKASATPAADSAPAPAGGDEKAWRDRFAKLRSKLAQDQGDLDVMQREIGVLDVQNYSDPVKAMQQQMTRSDITKKAADIDAKTKEVQADQQAITDAQDDLRKAGGDSGWGR